MKISQTEQLLFFFSRTPSSISKRVRQLTGKVAGELLRLLAELSLCKNRGSVECSYRQLGELLGKSVQTIARAAKLLLRQGDVVVEAQPGRSYRWSVLLDASDIREDPQGISLVRSVSQAKAAESAGPERIEDQKAPAAAEPAPTPEPAVMNERAERVRAAEAVEKDSKLLKRLTNLGMNGRVAREVLDEHDEGQILAALERVKGRAGIKNRAAYVLSELRDGGYEESGELVQSVGRVAAGSDVSKSYSSAELTRAERAAIEAERAAKQEAFNRQLQVLEKRCSGLSEAVKKQLGELCRSRVGQFVPQTASRESLLEAPTFKKLAFKEVMERFFSLVDQGFAPDQAVSLA